ncbi:hypothetical protein AVEN_175730-1 [Araneus ventricosus]|uniref:Uncharacterized protein n=1 Tax=Araneus ventricosus TaxID=182803 RepID=A0A4Y2FGH7_ARAVE|nr:hypothetical protein AVEN_175730-1 [Araneus ventricosus]
MHLATLRIMMIRVRSKQKKECAMAKALPMITMCIASYNKYGNGVDLIDNHAVATFISIQGETCCSPLFINASETAFVASWKLNHPFFEDA